MRDPNQIEAELAEERAALGGTLHELRETLDLGNLGRRVTDRLALGGEDALQAAMAQARRNPLAVGLTGAGLCLLLAGALRGGAGQGGGPRAPGGPGYASEAEAFRGHPRAAERDWTARARHLADEGAALPGEHPFVAGALAFALGALAARVLPQSRLEAEMLEDEAERLRGMGQAAADEAGAAARDAGRAAARMGEAAVDELGEIGASAGEAARDRARAAVRRVGEAGTPDEDP
ncbi:DUF3618 domain-containing protein [Frigidibacter sp. MR17.24]|uniref:DUF3618 domain-containing protein n=1 Tax=Frigidibacter sp. MR17.24 TaxID=3127345 RepID=UPI003012EDF9